jgi:tight adherence protein C
MTLATIAAFTAFLGVFMVVMALPRRPQNPLRARVHHLASQFRDEEPQVDLSLPFGERVVWPVLEGIANAFSKILPTAFVAHVRRLLMVAGQPFSLTGYFFLMAVSAVAIPGLYLALILTNGSFDAIRFLGLLLFLALGFSLPYAWLSRRVSRRQTAIIRSLPNALDLVTTCVEAGLGLESAFAKVAETMPGPFSEELAQALRDMAMGRGRREALRGIGERTGVTDVITFVGAIIHAETTGSPIGDVLRVQADAMRTRRRQRVERAAQKMPVWMTFPLILFLLPSLFIAILGPAGINAWESFVNR